MTACPLETEHHSREPFDADPSAAPVMGDEPILTENAAQAAMGKEDGPRPVPPDQGRFFPEVGVRGGNDKVCGGAAESGFSFEAVDPAAAGAEGAVFQNGVGLFYPFAEKTRVFQFPVRGDPSAF
jgi:hypothetical protein